MGRGLGRLFHLSRGFVVLQRLDGLLLRFGLSPRRDIGNRVGATLRAVPRRRRNRRQGSGFLIIMANDRAAELAGTASISMTDVSDAVRYRGPAR